MTYVFVDTNIFLHFKFFNDIPWGKLFGDPFKIVLAPIVVDELDKHKRHPNPKTSSRAKKVLSLFEQIVQSPHIFPLQYLKKRPDLETFQKFQLDRQEQDDSILATIIEFKEQHPKDDIVFISHDTGPRFRASSLDIRAAQLPDDLQNPNEISEEQKQIVKLTQENNRLKNAIPKLALRFKDGSTIFNHKFDSFDDRNKAIIEAEFETVNAKYPALTYDDPIKKKKTIEEKLEATTNIVEKFQLISLQNTFGINDLSEDQVKDYNKLLEDFLKKYKTYIEQKYKFQKIVALTLPIDIEMHNEGNAPATDIDIWLHFPDGFYLTDKDSYPTKPKKPDPPYKPKHKFDFGNIAFPSFPSAGASEDYRSLSTPINFSKPEIKQTNSYEVNVHFKSLKHFHSISIDPLFVIFTSSSKIINFTIDYRITTNNIPNQIQGTLSIVTMNNN